MSPQTGQQTASARDRTGGFPLYQWHLRGAVVRSAASFAMWLFCLGAYGLNLIHLHNLISDTIAVSYLVLMNPPALWVLKRIRRERPAELFGVGINFLEIVGYNRRHLLLRRDRGGLSPAHLRGPDHLRRRRGPQNPALHHCGILQHRLRHPPCAGALWHRAIAEDQPRISYRLVRSSGDAPRDDGPAVYCRLYNILHVPPSQKRPGQALPAKPGPATGSRQGPGG